jgi:glutamine amidotransferase
MTRRIALIDYGAGNLTSVRKAFAAVNADLFIPASAAELADAAAVVVPGVGHFGATRALDESWMAAIRDGVDRGRPLLGICLGMQWLYDGSEEDPDCRGLGVLPGRCLRLRIPDEPVAAAVAGPAAPRLKIPHVGWNAVQLRRDASLVSGIDSGAQVYFTHSYVAPVTADTVAVTDHGEPFAAIVQREHVAGVQFHPEKSGDVGLQILRNFLAQIS